MHKLRIYILFFGIAVFAIAVGGRLFFVQVVEADKYISQAEDQYVKRNYHFYDRGSIYFKDIEGDLVSAATVKSGYLVAINSDLISDPEKTAEELEDAIGLEKERFMEHYNKEKKYREVASRLSDKEAKKVRSLGLEGVFLYPEHWRFYPGKEIASHAIGFTSFKDHDYGGRYGLEREYEDVLKRPDNDYKVDFFAKIFGNISKGFPVSDGGQKEKRGDLITTIEPVVQAFLEQEMENVNEKWESRKIGGIIIDPSTGAIKAIASRPTFDLNNFSEVDSGSVFANPLVERVYEMGSVVKPLTMAAGLDSGAVKVNDTYYDSGRVSLDGYVISNFDGRSNGESSMQDVLNKSINTGVVYVMEEMGTDKFSKYMRA
ncbi:MAG: peptidoglycan D,D-transpeptidase FtsI family protein, partial [Patescibacteria group bacterium]